MLNLSDEWWFLGQVVHWIAWRDDAFAGGGALPEINVVNSPNAALQAIATERLITVSEKWEAAERELFPKLYDGALKAWGHIDSKAIKKIPKKAWANAGSDFLKSAAIVGYGSESGGDLGGNIEYQGRIWTDVHLPRSEVIRLWPIEAPCNDKGMGCAEQAADATRLKRRKKPEVIAKWMRERFPERPSLNRNEFMRLLEAENITEIGKFSPRTFDEALRLAYS